MNVLGRGVGWMEWIRTQYLHGGRTGEALRYRPPISAYLRSPYYGHWRPCFLYYIGAWNTVRDICTRSQYS